jgi:hypothetical protein
MASIKDYLAFYSARVDAIEVILSTFSVTVTLYRLTNAGVH